MESNTTYRLDIGYRELLRVAVPVSLGAFVQFIVAFTDSYFVAKLDGNSMSAVSFVGLIYITLAMFSIGLSNAAQIMIARRKGELRLDECGRTLVNALLIGIFLSVAQFLCMQFLIPPLLDEFVGSEDVVVKMKEFLEPRSWGFFFFTSTLIINSFWSGIARTSVMIYTTLIIALSNIVLAYSLVFGHFGMPELGLRGAAIANIIAEAMGMIFLSIYTLRHRESREYSVIRALRSPVFLYTLPLLTLGLPIMLQLVLSLGVWVVFYKMVGDLGEKQLQASFVVRHMYMLVYVSVGGMSTTIKTYVSGLIAENRRSELWIVIRRVIFLNLCGVMIMSHGLWLYPEWLSEQFSQDPETIRYSVKTMLVVLPAIAVFACSSVLLGAVEGSGNARMGFLI
ncbi:MAG: hypothetical protein RL220_1985, partial [Bacteroidota bacterium]